MASSLSEMWNGLGPVARLFVYLVAFVTIGGSFGFMSLKLMALNLPPLAYAYELVVKRMEVWRLVLPFGFHGNWAPGV